MSRVHEALQHYNQALADPLSGIPCQELQSGVRIFTGMSVIIILFVHMYIMYIGSDAIQWFINNMEGVSSIESATRIGNRLIELGMISEIQGIMCVRNQNM